MSATYVRLKVAKADFDALNDALATGEGVAEAAAVVAASPVDETTTFVGPSGAGFRVLLDKPVSLLWPQLRTDGEVSIPVSLLWLKGRPVTEARGTFDDARELIERLRALLP